MNKTTKLLTPDVPADLLMEDNSLDYQFTKDFITFLEEHKAKYEEALEEL